MLNSFHIQGTAIQGWGLHGWILQNASFDVYFPAVILGNYVFKSTTMTSMWQFKSTNIQIVTAYHVSAHVVFCVIIVLIKLNYDAETAAWVRALQNVIVMLVLWSLHQIINP